MVETYLSKGRANGWRYPLGVGGWIRRRNGKTQSQAKCLKTRRVPTCPLYALLGSAFNDKLVDRPAIAEHHPGQVLDGRYYHLFLRLE